jgi:cytosine/adenosine deaminase-related metal-dependent hydrolase
MDEKFRNVPDFGSNGSADGRGTIYVASHLVANASTSFSPGALAVANGVVIAAGPPADVERESPVGFTRVDLAGLTVLPGLVNSHTHLSIPRLSGRDGSPSSTSLSFVEWILRVIEWKRNVSPGEFANNVENASREALSNGTTGVGEIAGPDVAACASLPLRARVFAEGIGFDPSVAGTVLSSIEEIVSAIEERSRDGRMVTPGISPHTLYTVGPDLLRGLAALGTRLDLPLALHLAESLPEMEFLATGGGEVSTRLYPAVGKDVSFFRGIGEPISSYLRVTGILRKGLILVHNVHLSREEIDDLRAGGARFVLCPRSNRAHRNGSPDVTYFVDARIPFALGTDSLGSVDSLSMWDEMREAAGLYRGDLSEEELFRFLFRAATENGATILGLSPGTLTPGAPADFIAIEDVCVGNAGRFYSGLVGRMGRKDVRLTVIAGEKVYERA